MAVWFGLLAASLVALAFALDRLTLSVLRPRRRPVARTPEDVGLPWESFTVPDGPDDDAPPLEAWSIRGQDPEGPILLLAHGWGANTAVVLPLAAAAAPACSQIVAWDVRAHGRSEGAPTVSLRQFRDDALRTARFVDRARTGEGGGTRRPMVMVGHSMGGDAAILAADAGAPLDAIGLVATPCDVYGTVARYLQEHGIPGPAVLPLTRPFFRLRIGLPGRALDPGLALPRLHIPVLVIQPGADTRVPPTEGERLARLSGSEMVLIPGAGHTDVLDHPETGRALRDFLTRIRSVDPRGGAAART